MHTAVARCIVQPMETITSRVVVLIHDPIIEAEGGRRLHEVLGWNNPLTLANAYVEDVRAASHGLVNYQIVERLLVDGYPLKRDGFTYTDETYLRAWRSNSGFHQPDAADYPALLKQADFVRKVEADIADELWLFAFPYAGYYESCMGGRGAIWCNGEIIPGTQHVSRRFCVMGFNFERGVGEMLEDLGHRSENIMEHVFHDTTDEDGGWQMADGGSTGLLGRLFGRRPSAVGRSPSLTGNLWHAFTRYDKLHPGAASCGNVHFAPSSQRDYDWGNKKSVLTNADDWLNYPDFTGEVKEQDCSAWGHGDIRAHHIWWMQRFPHVAGSTPNGKPNNWWQAIVGLRF